MGNDASERKTYPQQWREYNLSQTRERSYFNSLLYELCSQIIEPETKRGRGRPSAPLADLIYAACLKVYGCMSGRRNQSDLDEAHSRGLLSRPVRYNTLFKYLELEVMTPYLQQLITESSLALKSVEVDFAVDSSGFGTCQYVRWFDVKHGVRKGEDWHDWIKLHLMCGVKTNVVTGVEVSRRYSNDTNYFKPLVDKTARNFTLREVSADKGYDSFTNRTHALAKGIIPYIPYREFTQRNRIYKGELWQRMYHFYQYNRGEFNVHYHKRSNVETTFQMIKARFGERFRSKTERAQINEALCKVLCHNICVVIQSVHELGIEPNFFQSDYEG